MSRIKDPFECKRNEREKQENPLLGKRNVDFALVCIGQVRNTALRLPISVSGKAGGGGTRVRALKRRPD